jgi:hypothetical protein
MRLTMMFTLVALLAAACGGTPISVDPATTERACAPGQQIECACPGGAPKAVQSCRADGSGYDQCACPSTADGGQGDTASSDAGHTLGPDAGSDAPSCSASLDSDSENCGACGHSCLGGACQAGLCAFVELASKQVVPSGLAVGDDAIFWTAEGTSPDYIGNVFALSLSDPTAIPTVIATSQKYPRALTFADGALYWGSYGDGAIGKWTAPTGKSELGVAPSGRFYNVVADSAHVYFAMEIDPSNNMPPTGAVARCPLDGCRGTPEIVATADAKIIGVAIDSGALFWSVFSSNGAIYRLTLDGASSPIAIAVGQALPINVAAFGGFVYWVNAGSGTVARASADAVATPTILASNQPSPSGLAVDDRGVYWTTNTRTGQLLKLAHGTSTPLVLASAQPSPGHVRLDANYAYWTNTGDGSIRRVPK